MIIGLNHFQVVSALLFGLGLLTIITRRNAVAVLMGVELVLNAGLVNLVAISRYQTGGLDGQIFALFGVVLAAAEAVVALAIVLQLFRARRSVDTIDVTDMRG
ncbi:NADH-quinone oxidoreductase subunit NuoK [Myxococcota bacterium]|nr:NADH-quinone oxidoreductase subunit NuoK [Myxococcota bacterium]MBU1430725.1 NADH-quinone oxidoreductase subunit NuoK [Myxococcota bacterium]MBU1898101.1 NADH-quinone oxidoreductase subunit NuoK [Myxococcota bacterium]